MEKGKTIRIDLPKCTQESVREFVEKAEQLRQSMQEANITFGGATTHIEHLGDTIKFELDGYEVETNTANTYPPRTDEICDEKLQKYNEKALIKCKHDLYEMTCPECNKGELRYCPKCDDYTYQDEMYINVCGACTTVYPFQPIYHAEPYWMYGYQYEPAHYYHVSPIYKRTAGPYSIAPAKGIRVDGVDTLSDLPDEGITVEGWYSNGVWRDGATPTEYEEDEDGITSFSKRIEKIFKKDNHEKTP